MRARPPLRVVLAAFAAGACAACTLDFDRYDPTDGGSDASSDTGYAGLDSGRIDSAMMPCTPSARCLTGATSCAATCTQSYQRCVNQCRSGNMGCMQTCTSQRQSCGGQCAATCVSCTQSNGCPASSECLAAGTP
jgi:hypothetical protein